MMEHRKNKTGTFLWFLCAFVPILNLYWIWKVTRVMVEHEEK
jgi:hypothetical protein